MNAILNRCYPKVEPQEQQETQNGETNKDIFEHKNLTIEYNNKMVKIDGQEIVLTKKEYEILVLLAKNPHKIHSREDILQHVWKEESYVLDRTVDVHIARLRKKMGQCGEWIVNRSGYGYCMHI